MSYSNAPQKQCINCRRMIDYSLPVCPYCGASQQVAYPNYPTYGGYNAPVPAGAHSRVTASLLAIFLGGFGAHKFYLGQTGTGIVYLLFCWTGITEIIGFIEGIVYLTMSDMAFFQKYR